MRRLYALAFSIVFSASASGQPYPGGKPVKIIVGFAPGGFIDTSTRVMASKLSEIWSVGVIVENRPGAGSTIAAAQVAKAPADGYTLLNCNLASHGIAPSMYRSLAYDPRKDFTAVAQIGTSPNVLIVHPSVPARSVAELIAYAKANPGKLSIASADLGTSPYLSGELFKSMSRIDAVSIPYKGGGPALSDLLGGQVPVAMNILVTALPHIRSGRVRALGITSATRSPQAPDLPTIAESGLPGFDVTSWSGICGPAKLVSSIVARINDDVRAVLENAEMKQHLLQQGIDAAPMTPDEFAAHIKREVARWAIVTKEAGLRPQ
jgi:tripartite-type tricarboxylate transporter receptor subunit TctC